MGDVYRCAEEHSYCESMHVRHHGQISMLCQLLTASYITFVDGR